MKVEKFIEEFKEEVERDSGAFIDNMKRPPFGARTDKSFCEWLEIYLAWMEFGNSRDCDRYYGHRR